MSEDLVKILRADDGDWRTDQAADRIEELEAERDHWRDVAGREGVCMSCRGPEGAPETYGCTDCLNTGYCGEHHNTVADLENKLEKAADALASAVDAIEEMQTASDAMMLYIARTTLATLKGQTDA